KLSNIIIKKILQYFLIGKYDINEYEGYKLGQLSNQYSMKYKDNNIDKVIRLSLVCKLWAKNIIPSLDYPFYHIIGHETLIPPIIRFGISKELMEFNNQIELEKLSIIVSDIYHKNIIAKAESDSLSLLWRSPPNTRGYAPLCYHLGFLSYGFDDYFRLVINKINETSYFFSNLQHVTIKIDNQDEMAALRKLLFQVATIKSLNITFYSRNSNTIGLVKTEGLCKSIESHPSITRLSLSDYRFRLPFECKNKFKEINFRDIIVLDPTVSQSQTPPLDGNTGSPTIHPQSTNVFADNFDDPMINRKPIEALSKLIENNLESLKRITIRNFSFEKDSDNSNHTLEVENIFKILSNSQILEYLDLRVNEVPYQLIRNLLQQCKSLKVLHIKSNFDNNFNYNNNNNNSNNNITITNNDEDDEIEVVNLNQKDNSNLIEYSFISSKGTRPILPISTTIKYLNAPNLTKPIIQSPIILNNLLSIVHDGSQTKDFNYLIYLIDNTTSLEKLVIKSIKPTPKNQICDINNWSKLFDSISKNTTLNTIHLLECLTLSQEQVDQFIESQHPTITNIKLHNTSFTTSKLLINHTFKFVNIAIDVSDLTNILIKNSTIKQLKITLTDYKISSSTLEILAKALKISKVPCIQLNRSFIFRSPLLLPYFKKFSYPI
ncbi:hypothetical protein DICPUDRAFT_15973, partial [Dictyostelium purpureum]